jgi:hypothetical protein
MKRRHTAAFGRIATFSTPTPSGASSPTAWRAYTRPRARRRPAGTPITYATRHTRSTSSRVSASNTTSMSRAPTSRSSFKLKGSDFVTVPYTIHMNDIASFTFEGWNPAAYEQALKDEFDQLYEEGAHRRRMMVIGLHDRISGHANRVRVLEARRLVCPQGCYRGVGT